jgi:ferrous iron transport protein A
LENDPMATQTLNELQPGQQAIVRVLTSEGLERRRLMDLGLLPGTLVEVELTSPLGDPTAYLVRGALVALRKEQAARIQVEIVTEDSLMEEDVS